MTPIMLEFGLIIFLCNKYNVIKLKAIFCFIITLIKQGLTVDIIIYIDIIRRSVWI